MTDYLSTYRPLIITAFGKRAVQRFGHPPYVDASIRREPDFESQFPSISAICHGGNFAPRLVEDDRVFFLTVKRAYPGHNGKHYRAVAALEVVKKFESHEDAAHWYRARGLSLPGNCIVKGNDPLGQEHSAHPRKNYRRWRLSYVKRARQNGRFLACRVILLELHAPQVVTVDDLVRIFGKVRGTRNPPRIEREEFESLLDLARPRGE